MFLLFFQALDLIFDPFWIGSWRKQKKDLVSFFGMWTSSFTNIPIEEIVLSLLYVHSTYVKKWLMADPCAHSFVLWSSPWSTLSFILRSSSLGQENAVGVLKPCIEMLVYFSFAQDCYIKPWLQVYSVFIWIWKLPFSSVIMNIIALILKIIWIIHFNRINSWEIGKQREGEGDWELLKV